MQRKITQVACLAVILAVTGCAGVPSVEMSSVDRGRIKDIRVRADSKMPEEMFFHSRTESFAAGFGGVIGAVAVQGASNESKAQIIRTMKSSNIDLPTIVKSEFQKALRARGGVNLASDNSPTAAVLTLTVNIYGLGQTQGFSSLLYPLLSVTASLRQPDGKVVWQKTEYVVPLNEQNTGGHEFDAYLANPELLRKTFTNVAAIASRQLVADLSPAI
jgi:hypothetical protein